MLVKVEASRRLIIIEKIRIIIRLNVVLSA
jgi:hypothetical protein